VETELDRANVAFWDELCGTGMAREMGIIDFSAESLKQYDQAYFAFYPYLLKLINPPRLAGKDVLEIGLGYGSLGQKIAESGANYCGLDLAAKPVWLLNERLRINSLPGTAVQGNCLTIPYQSSTFDFVISIGCFHHSGNIHKCITEASRVLKPGGILLFMVYNKFSLRRWLNWPLVNLREFLSELGLMPAKRLSTEAERRCYDSNSKGDAAPETVFSSSQELRAMLSSYSTVHICKQNSDDFIVQGRIFASRSRLLATVGRLAGLDLYVEAKACQA
jgi:SAM-dependent methyltransferase